MNTLQLTKKLISIPSYVNKENNEKELADFVYQYLKQFPFLIEIKKQKVEGKRFNVIASDGAKPKLLFIAHLDTVEPRGWEKRNPFKPTIEGDKLYGLGSMDMKAGMAAILTALNEFKKTKGLFLLFYCDEEYDFKGMKKFVEDYKISPCLAVSTEPTDLKIWNGARGIIKVSFRVEGKTAPASRPDQGKNAILGLVEAVKFLGRELRNYKSENLGISTCNIAAITGGLKLNKTISQKGDAVADIAEAVLDIRSGHPELEAKDIKKILVRFLARNKFKLTDFIIHHNLKAFYTKPSYLEKTEKIIKNTISKVDYLDLKQMGYQDIQIIVEKLKVPSFSFGPRGDRRHQSDEWVNIKDLDKVKEICQDLIKRYCFVL